MHFLVHAGIHTSEWQLQLAHAHRFVQVSGVWWVADSDANTDSDANANADSDANADTDSDANSGSKRSKQLDGDRSFHKSNQLVVDG